VAIRRVQDASEDEVLELIVAGEIRQK